MAFLRCSDYYCVFCRWNWRETPTVARRGNLLAASRFWIQVFAVLRKSFGEGDRDGLHWIVYLRLQQ